jgi:hypothetical protein
MKAAYSCFVEKIEIVAAEVKRFSAQLLTRLHI